MSNAMNNTETGMNFGTISKPILVLLRVIGIYPISIRKNRYTFSWLSVETTYAIFFYFGTCSIVILSAVPAIKCLLSGSKFDIGTSFAVIVIWRNILIPILGIISSKSLAVYFEGWKIVEEEFLTLTRKPLRFPYLKLTNRVLLCYTIIQSISFYFQLLLSKILTISGTVAHFHACMEFNSVVALWHIQARLIATAFRELGDNFTTMMCSCRRANATDIRKCRLLYSKIVSLTTSFEKSTNLVTIITCFYSYIHMVYDMYWVLVLISVGIASPLRLSILVNSLIRFMLLIVMICDAGQKITTAGGSQAPKPALAGSVKLDLGLVSTAFNITLAYLTVLFQFRDILE